MYQPKRRKKRYAPGLRSVELIRSRSGYGFTISGQQPCVLSCIINNSPADKAGLKTGDFLMSVNGQDISKALHDDVVRLIGSSTGVLLLQIAENCASSDSSDDDFVQRGKSKYGNHHRGRPYHGARRPQMVEFDEFLYPYGSEEMFDHHGARPKRQPVLPMRNYQSDLKAGYGRVLQERNGPNHVTSRHEPYGLQLAEKKRLKQFSASGSALMREPMASAGATKHTLITRDGRVIRSRSPVPTDHQEPHPTNYTARDLSNIFNPLIKPHVLPGRIVEEDTESSELNDSLGFDMCAVVGYIGSVELPRDAHLPTSRVHSIRSAIRRLRVDRKIHTLILIEVMTQGVRVINSMGSTMARYPRDCVAFAGVYPENKHYFGIVTIQGTSSDDFSSENSLEDCVQSSACHVFMVDTGLHPHPAHAQKAAQFGISCITNPLTQTCRQFPATAVPLVNCVAKLYQDREDLFDTTGTSNQEAYHDRSSSNSSNSDSGLGFGKEEGQVCVVDMHNDEQFANNDRVHPKIPRSLSQGVNMGSDPSLMGSKEKLQVSDSGSQNSTQSDSTVFNDDSGASADTLTQKFGAVVLKDKPAEPPIKPSTEEKEVVDSTGDEGPKYSTMERLNVRAMPPPKGFQRATSKTLDDQNSVDNLRQSSHRIMQARQRNSESRLPSDTGSTSSRDSGKKDEVLKSASTSCLHDSESAFSRVSKNEAISKLTGKPSLGHDDALQKLSPRVFQTAKPVQPAQPSVATATVRPIKKPGVGPKPVQIPIVPDPETPVQSSTPQSTKKEERQTPKAVTPDVVFKPPLPARKYIASKKQPKTPSASAKRPKSTPPLHYHKIAPKAEISECDTDLDTDHDVVRKKPAQDETNRRTSEGYTILRKRESIGVEDLDSSMPEVQLTWHRAKKLGGSHESLVVSEDYIKNQSKHVGGATGQLVSEQKDEGTRAASWAVSFDRLLKDPDGLNIFTEFLKKEFSEENVIFWTRCENYKKMTNDKERKKEAQALFDQHLAGNAPDPVNVDSEARRQAKEGLDNPLVTQFNAAQTQIFQLMKTDSYSRFLKSPLYKNYVLAEMEGSKPDADGNSGQSDKKQGKDEKKSMKKSKSIAGPEEGGNDEKRRKSLLPWKGKSAKKVPKVRTEPDLRKAEERKDNDKENNNTEQITNAYVDNDNKDADGVYSNHSNIMQENQKFCRVILPDTSTTVIYAKGGHSIRAAVKKLCDRRNLKVLAFEVFPVGSDKALDLDADISTLGSQEIQVERRVVFRVDLPNRKSIGIRSKPEKTIQEIFRPILYKYGYKYENMVVHVAGSNVALDPDTRLSTISGQRIYVQSAEDFSGKKKKDWGLGTHRFGFNKPPIPKKQFVPLALGSTDESANQMLKDMLEGKNEATRHFDDEGILDPETLRVHEEKNGKFLGFVRRNSWNEKDKTKVKVKPRPQTISSRPRPGRRGADPQEERLIELLTRAQSHRLDDQRGLTAKDLELPDFLKREDEDEDAASEQASEGASETLSIRSMGSKGDERGSQTSLNFGTVEASTFDNAFIKESSIRTGLQTKYMSPGGLSEISQISHVDQSFTDDGFLPSVADANDYFCPDQSSHIGLNDTDLQELEKELSSGPSYHTYRDHPKPAPRSEYKSGCDVDQSEGQRTGICDDENRQPANRTYVVRHAWQDGAVGKDLTDIGSGTPVLPSPPPSWQGSLEDLEEIPADIPPVPLVVPRRSPVKERLNLNHPPRALPPYRPRSTVSLPLPSLSDQSDNPAPSPSTHDIIIEAESPAPTPHPVESENCATHDQQDGASEDGEPAQVSYV